MKTTIKISPIHAVSVEPGAQGVSVSFSTAGLVVMRQDVTIEQAEALIFGLEQALEVVHIHRMIESERIGAS